jgi:hypothetical protein
MKRDPIRLKINVTLERKGTSLTNGLFFTYAYADPVKTKAFYLHDASGNIVIPESESEAVEITFRLKTTQMRIGGQLYDISFKLAPDSALPQLHPLMITATSGPIPPGLFDIPPVNPDHVTTVVATVKQRDRAEYAYRLLVGVRAQSGATRNVEHDPKIRNGGNPFDPGPIGGRKPVSTSRTAKAEDSPTVRKARVKKTAARGAAKPRL